MCLCENTAGRQRHCLLQKLFFSARARRLLPSLSCWITPMEFLHGISIYLGPHQKYALICHEQLTCPFFVSWYFDKQGFESAIFFSWQFAQTLISITITIVFLMQTCQKDIVGGVCFSLCLSLWKLKMKFHRKSCLWSPTLFVNQLKRKQKHGISYKSETPQTCPI